MIKTYDELKSRIIQRRGYEFEQDGMNTYRENPNFAINLINNSEGEFFCPSKKCNDSRNMDIEILNYDNIMPNINLNPAWNKSGYKAHQDSICKDIDETIYRLEEQSNAKICKIIDNILNGTLIKLICKQCKAQQWLVIYKSSHGMDIAFLSEYITSIATKNTPYAVSFYLEQAHKAKNAGANSAAVTMYRAALEQLLYDKGYIEGMLGKKVGDLINDINSRQADPWTKGLNEDIFTIIKNLGNGAIHANGGDISRQAALDNKIINTLDIMFGKILYEAYEKEAIENTQLDELRLAVESLNTAN